MLEQIPNYLNLIFILITVTTIIIFYSAAGQSKKALIIIIIWAILQAILAYLGFYAKQNIHPLQMLFSFMPAMVFGFFVLLHPRNKNFIQKLSLPKLTLLHTIRIPVELCLYLLFINKAIPELMTFDGRNYDILAGITAPIIFYFAFYKKNLSKDLFLAWNFISLFLLLNIIVNALLSLELPFQQFAFEQPNKAIRYFPFIWLPSVVVPIVLFSHLFTIKRLLQP